jgi:pimeloyl-ACP methyl ester carboxylesterase
MVRRPLATCLALALALVASVLTSTVHAQEEGGGGLDPDAPEVLPIVFVHGFLGSGQQFEAMALRLTSNGYPEDHIEMFEHDSLAWGTGDDPAITEPVWGRIDGLVDELLERTGDEQVYLAGHSQGTSVLQGYLDSSPERAARVARYVNLDGATDVNGDGQPPGGVETLAVWGEGDASREVPGATNVRFPDQSHTEVVNSPETFGAVHEFLLGEAPRVDEVVRQPADEITVSGRAQLFPQNTGAPDVTLSIYEVDGETGMRLDDEPEATFTPDETGAWGPFEADGDAFYEFALTRDDQTHHIYVQRFVRSTRWMRLLTSEPGGLADSFWQLSDTHQNLVVLRNQEWWGDQGDAGDTLEINGQPVLNEATSPRSNRTLAVFVHDAGLDHRSDVTHQASPTGITFLTGVDLFIPASDPPDGTTGVVTTPRRGDGTESLCLPNWMSSRHRSSVQLASYHHLLDADGSPAEGHANPECAPPPPVPAAPAVPVPLDEPPVFTG